MRSRRALVIGVTGQIGSGKSTAAEMLASFGGTIVDADQISREIVRDNPKLLGKLVAEFGPEILTATGRLSRKRLAAMVFPSSGAVRTLNRLIHPYILKEMRSQIAALSIAKKAVIVDAPLLFGSSLEKQVDFVLVVHTSRAIRLARLTDRGIDRYQAKAREVAQLPFAELRRRADRVVLNSGTMVALETKLLQIWKRLIGN